MTQLRTARGPAAALALVALAACADLRPPVDDSWSLVAAGDIASCWWGTDEMTARLLDRTGGVVLALGDNVYQDGTEAQFKNCYGPNWGRHLDRTRTVAGNHDDRTEGGGPFYAYFGGRAGTPGEGWYAWDLDGWRIIALNSEVDIEAGSAQLAWLRRELAENGRRCTLVYMHRPRFSSGKHGPSARTFDAFRVMYEGGVDVLLGAHEHNYERFAPQDTAGRADPRGVRQFVVGTGGAPSYPLREILPNSEVARAGVHGVLRMRLREDGYDWEFVPIARHRFTDAGTGTCR